VERPLAEAGHGGRRARGLAGRRDARDAPARVVRGRVRPWSARREASVGAIFRRARACSSPT
jgi:hypothetical protein